MKLHHGVSRLTRSHLSRVCLLQLTWWRKAQLLSNKLHLHWGVSPKIGERLLTRVLSSTRMWPNTPSVQLSKPPKNSFQVWNKPSISKVQRLSRFRTHRLKRISNCLGRPQISSAELHSKCLEYYLSIWLQLSVSDKIQHLEFSLKWNV